MFWCLFIEIKKRKLLVRNKEGFFSSFFTIFKVQLKESVTTRKREKGREI
jgi:hypothetical protein